MSTRSILRCIVFSILIAMFVLNGVTVAAAQSKTNIDNSGIDTVEVAKKMANPIAKHISIPIETDFDFVIGPAHATRVTTYMKPRVPVSLTRNWDLIIETTVPLIYTQPVIDGWGSSKGMGDIQQNFFFTPAQIPAHGWLLAAGPGFQYPTGTNERLGRSKFSMGPIAAAFTHKGGWTYGAVAGHLWSLEGTGTERRTDINATVIEPAVAYTTKTATSISLSSKSAYDWLTYQWIVPFTATVSQVVKIDKQPVQFSLGTTYYAGGPVGGPRWGMVFTTSFAFPK
jgi:hypothetical protein